MARLKAANNAQSLLSANITASATSLTVADGSVFPEPPFLITIDDEIIEVGAKTGNTFSGLLRGQEGTVAAPHSSGAIVENRMTAGSYNELVDQQQFNELQNTVVAHLAEMAQLARYRINANQSIPNATDTILALTYKDPLLNDDFSELDGNNIRFLKAGVYEVKIAVLWANNSTGYRRVEAFIDNSVINTRISQNATIGTYTTQMLSLFLKAGIGTLLNARVYQDSGGALDIMNDTRQCYIMIKKVG